ncbi:MAG: amidohydrolase family protein, partial [Candidatus Rokubacteria bacterium]|nr:amidohydrolase family protein [Candidatus Rokubacteria bacterium]
GELTLRVRWYMQPNRPGQEIQVIREFIEKVKPGSGDDWLRPVGIGEQVTVGTFDGDAFVPNPPTFSPQALEDWKTIVKMIADSGWRFQAHATRDNSVRQLLPALEEMNKQISLKDRRIAFAHLEDVTVETIERIKAVGGGITVQDRLIYHGEDVVRSLGRDFTRRAPPLKTMLSRGIPVGGGTDATRTAPYPPFWSIWWLITGKTLSGESIRGPEESLSREEALRLYTTGSAWFSFDEGKLGSIEAGKLADLIVLTADYLAVPEDQIKDLHSVLTIVGGKPVYGEAEYAGLVPR